MPSHPLLPPSRKEKERNKPNTSNRSAHNAITSINIQLCGTLASSTNSFVDGKNAVDDDRINPLFDLELDKH
jgi:hypothetical protein